jgi:hypothetical protein
MPSKPRQDDEPIRKKRVNDDEPIRSKRVNVSRYATRPPQELELVTLGIIGLLGFVVILPNCIFPLLAVFSFAVGLGLIFFGFLKACLAASRDGNHIEFDYLAGIGPLRWVLAVGFFGMYLMGYLALWIYAQVASACNKPKAVLPWFAVEAYGVMVIVFGFGTGLIGERLWHLGSARPTGPIVSKPDPAQNGKDLSKDNNNPPADRRGPIINPPVDRGGPKIDPPTAVVPPVVTGDKDLDKKLADVAGADDFKMRQAASALAEMMPNEHRTIVARKLNERIRTVGEFNRGPFIRALGVWATSEEIPTLIELLDDKSVNTRNQVLQVLGKLRDERSVKPIVRCFTDIQTRWHGERAIKDLGSMAEKEVLALLKQPDKGLWVPAINLLAEIGTEESVPILQTGLNDISVRSACQNALMAIGMRVKK